MGTINKGEIAESGVLHALVGSGATVFLPFGSAGPVDLLAVMPDDSLVRVQCKHAQVRNSCVTFKSCSTDHGRGPQTYRGRADVIAAYLPESGRTFVIAADDAPPNRVWLRLEPARNNQRAGVRFADDYELSPWAARYRLGIPFAAAA